MNVAAEGLQDLKSGDSYGEDIQQQAAEFAETVAQAQKAMAEQMAQFQEMVTQAVGQVTNKEPEKPTYKMKWVDDGLWLDRYSLDAMMMIFEVMAKEIESRERK